MNIIVLGNGFDLAHGLPTRYTDFLKYCRNYDGKHSPISINQHITTEFEECIRKNIWLSYFLKTTPDLNEDKTWIDFEVEILKVIQGICPSEWSDVRDQLNTSQTWKTLIREEFETGQYGIFRNYLLFSEEKIEGAAVTSSGLESPIMNVKGLYSQLRKFTRAFEIYCCQIVNEKCGIRKRFKLNESLLLSSNTEDSKQKTYIVSFNYTRTFNKYYDYDDSESPAHFTYVYPHGEACTDVTVESAYDGLITSGLVLGTRSFDRKVYDKEYEIPVDFNVFQKHNQQHRYSTLADFQHLLMELRKSSDSEKLEPVNIFVIGHSLDISDHAKLKHLFTENQDARITVFYHDEASFQRYINNITDILGESDVAVRVRFYHQNNYPNGLLLPYWGFKDGRGCYNIIDSSEDQSVEDQVCDILTDYFLSNGIPSSLDELSTHTTIEYVTAESIDNVELKDNQYIVVEGSGSIATELQIGSNGDLRRGDGDVSCMTFPLTFTLFLISENSTGKPEDEKYVLDDVDYRIDTSSYYGE